MNESQGLLLMLIGLVLIGIAFWVGLCFQKRPKKSKFVKSVKAVKNPNLTVDVGIRDGWKYYRDKPF